MIDSWLSGTLCLNKWSISDCLAFCASIKIQFIVEYFFAYQQLFIIRHLTGSPFLKNRIAFSCKKMIDLPWWSQQLDYILHNFQSQHQFHTWATNGRKRLIMLWKLYKTWLDDWSCERRESFFRIKDRSPILTTVIYC